MRGCVRLRVLSLPQRCSATMLRNPMCTRVRGRGNMAALKGGRMYGMTTSTTRRGENVRRGRADRVSRNVAFHHTTHDVMDQQGRLNVGHLTQTKIICTLGPASTTEPVLRKMIEAGLDLARLNLSHGSHEEHRSTFALVQRLSKEYDHQVGILADIQGPKIRVGNVDGMFEVDIGDTIMVTSKPCDGTPERIQIKYPTIVGDLDQGDTIFINDGIVKLEVVRKHEEAAELECVVRAGGCISSNKGCNIPSGNLTVNIPTDKDVVDLKLLAELKPEYIAVSFVGCAADMDKVRAKLRDFGHPTARLVAKIERPVALTNLDEIIAASDAVMVARGDLGVEVEAWDVPPAQKDIILRCNRAGRPVITATQMLESMTINSRPTRAEVTDVYNSVVDGTDCVMLSGETSVGRHPVEAVQLMDKIIHTAAKHMPPRDPNDFDSPVEHGMVQTVAHSAWVVAREFIEKGWSGKIITIAETVFTPCLVAKYRPALDVITFTSSEETARALAMVWGCRSVVHPELATTTRDVESRAVSVLRKCVEMGLLVESDRACVVQSSPQAGHGGASLSLFQVGDVLKAHDVRE